MKNIIFAIGGFTLAVLLFLFVVYPQVKTNWRAQRQTEGYLEANVTMHRIALKHFPNSNPNCTTLEVLGGAKPDRVEIVDCGNFKTLRVVND